MSSHRFGRSARLKRSADFRRVTGRGKRISRRAFVLIRLPSQANTRLGVTVSRRVGNAVVRNRVKRRIREWYRQHQAELKITGELVVIARPQAASLTHTVTNGELSRGVQLLLSKA